jgi:hypothetical protein
MADQWLEEMIDQCTVSETVSTAKVRLGAMMSSCVPDDKFGTSSRNPPNWIACKRLHIFAEIFPIESFVGASASDGAMRRYQ